MMNVLKYWRNSLADADWLDPNFNKMKPSGFLIEYDAIKRGVVSSDTVQQFISKCKDKDKKTIFDVVVCPAVTYVKKEHGSTINYRLPEAIAPLWIPALLDVSGTLKPHPRYTPWICRDYLEPSETEVLPMGNIDQVDEYLSTRSVNRESWADYLNFALELFKNVTGFPFSEWTHEQYRLSDESYLFINDLVTGTSRAIQDLYGNIEIDQVQSPLQLAFASIESQPPLPAWKGIDSEKLSVGHYGQMSNQFYLSNSQRQAMHHATLLNNGDLIAVNGPPGTGKTTLLQSVVATSVVHHALHKMEPPVIVVTSTNNNAVTNVIGSFGKVNEVGENPLSGRWIPDITSYGSYLRSSFKDEHEDEDWLTVMTGQGGFRGYFEHIETTDFLAQASQYYLEKCSQYFAADIATVDDAIDLLHGSLVNVSQEIQDIINTHVKYQELEVSIKAKYPEGIQNVIQERTEHVDRAIEELAELEKTRIEWKKFLVEEPWWIPLLLKVPVVKNIAIRKKQLRNSLFCSLNQLPELPQEEQIDQWFTDSHNRLRDKREQAEAQLSEVMKEYEEYVIAQKKWEEVASTLSIEEEETYLEYLDRTNRYEAFKLAVHYWEGQWLLETERMLSDPSYNRKNGKKGRALLWRRLAKLTPCFVTTLYMLPTFFSAYQARLHPMYEYIDMLIIDEAGQVVPEVAGASFALAKKAIIVGDTLQIQPVWSIPIQVDMGNLQRYGLQTDPDAYDELRITGIPASCGSVMEIARRHTKYTISESDGGFLLTEHRRCVPEIIAYCNELAYYGKLEPKRKSIKDYLLPHMGYAHIPGTSRKRGGSLENKLEAEVIVSWIDRNKDKLLEYYSQEGLTRIEDIVAIVTPFSSQKWLLLNKLKRAGLKGVKAGTVHTLQGDERPIVLFSPVYDSNYSSRYFFDQGVPMLNVAVSRARDSFLVFGDMGVFSPARPTPSGLLAKYLFAKEENEIKNIDLGDYFNTRYGAPVEHIHELEAHQQLLRDCIQSANQEIHIVSPYLSSVAIEADQLQPLFDEAVKRGITVSVYTNEALNYNKNELKYTYVKAKQILQEHGVQLHLTDRVHSKALWVDTNVLIEGSFNWLSARRNPSHQWCYYETSLVYRGPDVGEMIGKIREDLEKRKLVQRISV
ncbi:AAA domain-containing protein [Paenibacillus humicus]|uniref:AAA domain-containing protein n=1 Tax=Paenibacillus humicus TaxID=412861 RepID=UPI003D275CE1